MMISNETTRLECCDDDKSFGIVFSSYYYDFFFSIFVKTGWSSIQLQYIYIGLSYCFMI